MENGKPHFCAVKRNRPKKDQTRKLFIKVFKDIEFKIQIKTNIEIVDFRNVIFNLLNGICSPYKKPNDHLPYVHTSSNHPAHIMRTLPKSISEGLSKNSSSRDIFEISKSDYEKFLEDNTC